MSDTNNWPIVGIDSNERYDHSSGEPLPMTYGEVEYRRGWTDGRLGVRVPHTYEVYQFRARRWCDEHRLAIEQKVERARAERNFAQARAQRAEGEVSRIYVHFVDVDTERLGSPSSYSVLLGIVYCFVALLLWIADLPLSLLAADGLDIRTNYAQIADLTSLFQGWKSMWEPLAFSIGIAVLGLFFKFVADFFFKPKLQRHVWMRVLSTILLIGLITLVIWNLYSLAQLRTGIKSLHEAQRAAAASGTPLNVTALTEKMQKEAARSFILLTLTLPIIGGICASVGWSRIESVVRYRTLKSTWEKSQMAADELNHESLAADANLRSLENDAKAARQVPAEDVAAAAEYLYEQGFTRGRLVPETIHNGRRLHERAQFAVKRLLGISERQLSESASSLVEEQMPEVRTR
ncbi:MAG: hypothetical protein DMF56_11685 [Acidobacteria bacterium]|nr:MAG: hypothetical protein DMF56_11685 [Acidobacteriota bacterium]